MASFVDQNVDIPYTSRRSAVYGTQYMVASTQPLATDAGIQILAKGGNAADAAVAVAAALGVTEPFSTGLGGDCFCLFYSAKDRRVRSLNGSGRAPAGLTIDRLRNEFDISGSEIPFHNVHGATVPGAAAGWVDTVAHFGSGNLSLADIFQPAIELAEHGFPVGELTAPFWRAGAEVLLKASPNGGELLINGNAPLPGQVFRNPGLASTMRHLAKRGAPGFYEGPVADAIIECLRAQKSVMTHGDLRAHQSTLGISDSLEYRKHRLHESPPNGSGLAALLALGIVDTLETSGIVPSVDTMVHNGAEYLHMVIETLRLAFADARHYVCDPAFHSVPVSKLLAAKYLAERAKRYDPMHAAADVSHGRPLGGSDTVYFTVVDQEGNACSFVNSLYHSFGTGIVPRGCGFAIHDRGGLFSLDPSHANCLEPGKRPYHTIIPAMVTVDGDLFMSYGIMGGYNQPQAHLQVLLNAVCFGMNPQQALDAPRICIQVEDDRVAIEDGVDQKTIDALRRMGHNVYVVTGLQRSLFGRGQIIKQYIDQSSGIRVLVGGSDPRSDGQAQGR
ncbi:hypothetical protein GGI15_001933 [Coemansia interrupta]|uniref:Gamma-glutamyltransferase n=1 Tax=Coemansia interrupta TaxID=1126814 RepID=A0A9W8HKV5_9FUNG|nr:hypothetical protein GGI15_001933 [Coemansia interrupta]